LNTIRRLGGYAEEQREKKNLERQEQCVEKKSKGVEEEEERHK
jgi:hypothetical protein